MVPSIQRTKWRHRDTVRLAPGHTAHRDSKLGSGTEALSLSLYRESWVSLSCLLYLCRISFCTWRNSLPHSSPGLFVWKCGQPQPDVGLQADVMLAGPALPAQMVPGANWKMPLCAGRTLQDHHWARGGWAGLQLPPHSFRPEQAHPVQPFLVPDG